MSAFLHTPFGWAGWALNWLGSSIFFHNSPYYSHSTSVAHWGGYGGRYGSHYGSQMGGINRQPRGFERPQPGLDHFAGRSAEQGFNRPGVRTPESYGANRGFEGQNRAYPGGYARPGMQNYAYSRPQAQMPVPAREQAYARLGGSGSGFFANAPRTMTGSQQYARGGSSSYQRNDFAQRSDVRPRSSFGRSGAESFRPTERSGGSHTFGGSHGGESVHASYHAPKAPKAPKMSGGHHGGGGHSSHHGR